MRGLIGIGACALGIVILLLWTASAWSASQPSTQRDVRDSLAAVDPACRPVVADRLRARITKEARPLTRREVSQVADEVRGCAAIGEQLQGLNPTV